METVADGQIPAACSLQGHGSRGSADVHVNSGSGRTYQLPQRFKAKREKNKTQFHNHKEAAPAIREDMNLNNLLAAKHALPIPFQLSPSTTTPISLGRGGIFMFPAGANGHMVTKIGPYKEPLLPSVPPPLLQHHGGLNLGPLAFAHHANVKAAMQAMSMFSSNRKDPEFMVSPSMLESSKQAYSVIDMHKARMHSRSESASSVGSVGAVHDASLKKLMKDLHRCEVSISRYQTMLNEHCDAGLRALRQAFITLHIGLNTREKDIARELQMTRQTAGTILQHRHSTACVLRQLAERAGELEEAQLHELKKQIKQFVADRKVDEEIGTTSRFIADPDDLLPHVMSFGRVVNRRHVYTSWEGDPAAAVEKRKHNRSSVFSSPSSSLPTTPSPPEMDEQAVINKSNSQELLLDDSVFMTPDQENEDIQRAAQEESVTLEPMEGEKESNGADEISSDMVLSESNCSDQNIDHSNEGKIGRSKPDTSSSLPSSPISGSKHIAIPLAANSGMVKPSTVTASPKGRLPCSRKFSAPIVVTHTRRHSTKPLPKTLDPKSTVTLLLSTSLQQKNKHKNQKGIKRQFSPSSHSPESGTLEENTSNASRDSRLKYREKERELWRKRFSSSSSGSREQALRSSESGGEGMLKYSPEELSTIQSRVRESLRAQGVFLYDPVTGATPLNKKREESVDSGVGKSEPDPDAKTAADLKKKTPTQLRRERKKRQKERERRQKELERRALEEGGESRGGRVTQVDKTSANPSTSTSRTTSPLSSVENNTSDTQMESVSLSQSQSPPPHTDEEIREQGSKSNNNIISTMTATQGKITTKIREEQQSENKNIEFSTIPVKEPESLGQTASTLSESASIEWDMSQMRQEKAAVSSTTPESVVHRKIANSGYSGELVNRCDAEMSSQHDTNAQDVSMYNVTSLNPVPNGVVHHSSSQPHSASPTKPHTTPPTTLETHAANPLPPISSVTPSSVHHNKTETFVQSSSSQAHILEPQLPSKQLKDDILCLDSRLDQNGDSGQNFVLNEHEE